MATRKKSGIKSGPEIISLYMKYCSEEGHKPDSLSDFCEAYHISEAEFKTHFSTMPDLEMEIWNMLMNRTLDAIKNDGLFDSFNRKEKMLSFYYTFFENLAINKDYIYVDLPSRSIPIIPKGQFKQMKISYSNFIDETFRGSDMLSVLNKFGKIGDIRKRGLREGFWQQLIFLISFWRQDDSEKFEKTDIAIEKSVTVALDLIDTSRIENFLDFGKFIWNEQIVKR